MNMYFEGSNNLVIVFMKDKDEIKISCDNKSRPVETLMNFFLKCCNGCSLQYPDFSEGIQKGIVGEAISSDKENIIIASNDMTIFQYNEDPYKGTTDLKMYKLSESWEDCCANFLDICNEAFLAEYIVKFKNTCDTEYSLAIEYINSLEKKKALHKEFCSYMISRRL